MTIKTKLTLLEQAKLVRANRSYNNGRITDEDIELTIAWFTNDISLKQIMEVKKITNSASAYLFLAMSARELYNRTNK